VVLVLVAACASTNDSDIKELASWSGNAGCVGLGTGGVALSSMEVFCKVIFIARLEFNGERVWRELWGASALFLAVNSFVLAGFLLFRNPEVKVKRARRVGVRKSERLKR
jgi:hypothetical protein